MSAWLRALEKVAPFAQGYGPTLPAHMTAMAERFGGRPALISREQCLTYAELADRADRFGRWAIQQSLRAGQTVCLLMPNCPDYVAIWLGLSGAGVVVSLLNTNLTGDALAHAVRAVLPTHLLVHSSLEDAVVAVHEWLPAGLHIWAHGPSRRWQRIDRYVEAGSRLHGTAPLKQAAALTDPALFIYTSGTTGLPKAAYVSHRRVMEWSCWFAGMLDAQPTDRLYNCLPMYHSIGGVVAVGAMLANGGSVLIRERFSATRFWEDIREGDCTLFQYIGELCRYLLLSPPRPDEASHRVRACFGNGLRADIWEPFRQRFRIPRILEFYAATEGNVSLYNCEGKPGSIGRIPPFLANRFPIALVRCDMESGEPVRGADGFCIRCGGNEAGEALGRIRGASTNHGKPFEGYTDPQASERKILRDVFAEGDAWFRTGDLLRRDGAGFFYFVDRLGDTFRWKGENVSTEEVAAALQTCTGVTAAIVYGVRVTGTEGRACAVAITVDSEFDLGGFYREAKGLLPDYALPLFVRVCQSVALTSTFKPVKGELIQEGYNPRAIRDRLYFNDRAEGSFVTLDESLYERIEAGTIPL